MPTGVIYGTALLMLIPTVSSLSCVQCSTVVHQFRDMCKEGTFSPEICLGNATHCIKYEGVHQNIDFVFRDCVDSEVEPGCRRHNITSDISIHMCFYACTQDGCNHGTVSYVTKTTIAVTLTLLQVFK